MDYLPRLGDLLPLLPGAAAGVLLLAIAGLLSRGAAAPSRVAPWLAGLAFPAGHVCTWMMTHASFPMPPNTSSERMLIALPLAGAVAALAAGRSRRIGAALPYLAIAGLTTWLLWPLLADLGVGRLALTLAGIALFWFPLVRFHRQLRESLENGQPAGRLACATLPVALCLACGAAGQALVVFGSATLGQLAGTASITAGAYAALAWASGWPGLPRPALAGLAAVAVAVVLDGWFFMVDPLPGIPAGLIAAAPLLSGLGTLPQVSARTPVLRLALPIGAVLACLGVAMALVFAAAPPPDPYADFGK